MAWHTVIIVGFAVVAAIAVGIVIGMAIQWTRGPRIRPGLLDAVGEQLAESPRELVAFVANPSKPDVTGLEDTVRRMFAEAALPDPLWFETTVEDPGVGQTRAAIDAGADVIVAVGGDGTVRAVAEGLVGTGRTMGLVPVGTGNLLARNLDLPVADPVASVGVVIAGSDRAIDVGWVRVTEWGRADSARADDADADDDTDGDDDQTVTDDDTDHGTGADRNTADAAPAPDSPDHVPGTRDDARHIFLVIAGLGFDAAMVADTDDALKAKVGWVAYFLGGIRHLHGRRMRARIALDDRDPIDARLRTLLIGNCGKLPGGITLLPGAAIDDGILDVAAVDTRGGLVGWAQLFGEVVMQGFGIRNDLPAKVGRIDHTRAKHVRVRVDGEEQAQVDGDVLGAARALDAWVDPGALVVRTG